MRKLLTLIVGIGAMICSNLAKGETFTADDFCGPNKFCTQLFYANQFTSTDLIATSSWSRFEKIDDTHIRLQSFCNGKAMNVKFTIVDGNKLSVDGTNTSDGYEYKNSSNKNVRLVCSVFTTYKLINNRYWFKDKEKDYVGNIVRVNDKCIRVTLYDTEVGLKFKNHTILNYATDWNDYMQTYNMVVFNVYDSNDSMVVNGETIPLYIESDVDKSVSGPRTVYIHNYMGRGEAYYHSTISKSEILRGVEAEMNPSTKVLTINKQYLSANFSATYKEPLANTNANTTFQTDKTTLTNVFISDATVSTDVTGSSADVVLINNGWHQNYGGGLSAYKAIVSNANWSTYESPYDATQTNNIANYDGNTITYHREQIAMPSVEIYNPTFLYNDWAMQVTGSLINEANTEMLDSYDVFCVVGEYATATTEVFDQSIVGSPKAYRLTDESIAKGSSELTFDKIFYRKDLEDMGWDPTMKITLYVRYNLNDGTHLLRSIKKEPASQADPTYYGFGAMKPVGPTITTGIGEIMNDDTKISINGNVIEISGNSNVEVYEISGKAVYVGKATELTVTPGVYIVKTPTTTLKAIVK